MLSRAFFTNERLRDGELPKDNSSSARVSSSSSGRMGPFPLSRAIGCALRVISYASRAIGCASRIVKFLICTSHCWNFFSATIQE